MIKKSLVILLLGIFVFSFAYAQEIKITGNIYSRGQESSIQKAEVDENKTSAVISTRGNFSNESDFSLNFTIAEVNLSSGWNLFSFTKNDSSLEENVERNLSEGFNFIGYSSLKENKTFSGTVKINSSNWSNAVSNGWVLDNVLKFNSGFYQILSPSFELEKHGGYIIYVREPGLNLTMESVSGNLILEFEIDKLKVKNLTSKDVFWFSSKMDEWFYPINGMAIYKHNETQEDYIQLGSEDNITTWDSYWIRSKYDNLSLVIHG